MRNPFRRRRNRTATPATPATPARSLPRRRRATAVHREPPRDFRQMTRAEQLEWCGQVLEGLVPLRPDDPDDD